MLFGHKYLLRQKVDAIKTFWPEFPNIWYLVKYCEEIPAFDFEANKKGY